MFDSSYPDYDITLVLSVWESLEILGDALMNSSTGYMSSEYAKALAAEILGELADASTYDYND